MERLGADRARITAVIGPTISQPPMRSGPNSSTASATKTRTTPAFSPKATATGCCSTCPPTACTACARPGVGHAEWTRHCTYRDPDRFFSYRRTVHLGEADYGRLIAAIRL
jgi:polyphenol oxidase